MDNISLTQKRKYFCNIMINICGEKLSVGFYGKIFQFDFQFEKSRLKEQFFFKLYLDFTHFVLIDNKLCAQKRTVYFQNC